MGIKDVPPGAHVGYGTSFRAERSIRLATVPVGYGQGFARSLSNGGKVLIAGREAVVVGVVNMSMLLADVSDIPGAGHGDEVTLIGRDGDAEIRAASFSDPPGRPTYEMLVKLDPRIPRSVVD
jgi:alanine racemase